MNKYINYLNVLKDNRIFPTREAGKICSTCFYYTNEIKVKDEDQKKFEKIKKRIGTFIKCRNPNKQKKDLQFDYCTLHVIK